MSFSGRHGEEGGRELSAEAGPTWSGWRGSCHPWRRRQGCRAIAAVTMSLSPQPIGEICPGPQLSCSALRPRLGSSQVACGWAVCGWRVGPGRRPQQRSAASVQRLSFLFCFGFEIRIPMWGCLCGRGHPTERSFAFFACSAAPVFLPHPSCT